MKIALFGYGKMGRMIEQLAAGRGHEIVARVTSSEENPDFSAMDVAIDFSTPEAAFGNITRCLENQVPVICGTTGWLDRYQEVKAVCEENKSAFIYASNFSLGVNLFFALNEQLAKLMKKAPGYNAEIEEIHHIHKLDAPSGTAITLAEGIMDHSDYNSWTMEHPGEGELPVRSIREGEIPGTHTIGYHSEIDSIEIRHTAHNRKGFALGALVAAEWIVGKTGIFTMKDVLELNS